MGAGGGVAALIMSSGIGRLLEVSCISLSCSAVSGPGLRRSSSSGPGRSNARSTCTSSVLDHLLVREFLLHRGMNELLQLRYIERGLRNGKRNCGEDEKKNSHGFRIDARGAFELCLNRAECFSMAESASGAITR